MNYILSKNEKVIGKFTIETPKNVFTDVVIVSEVKPIYLNVEVITKIK